MEVTLDQFIMWTSGRALILHHVYSFLSQLHLNRHFCVYSAAFFNTAAWVPVIPCVSHQEFSARSSSKGWFGCARVVFTGGVSTAPAHPRAWRVPRANTGMFLRVLTWFISWGG